MDLETIRIQTLSVMQLDGLLKLCNCLKETGFDDKIQLMFIADKLSDLETVLHGLQRALGYQEALKRELELDASIRGKENQIESLKKEEESIRERIGHLQEVLISDSKKSQSTEVGKEANKEAHSFLYDGG